MDSKPDYLKYNITLNYTAPTMFPSWTVQYSSDYYTPEQEAHAWKQAQEVIAKAKGTTK